jgi:ATP-binding cassette, subfamily B, bacterial
MKQQQTNKQQRPTALRAYVGQIMTHKQVAFPGLLLPGISIVFTGYIPPLLIAAMMRDFNGQIPSDLHRVLPYILLFLASWLFGEVLWRFAFFALNRTDSRSIRDLYNYSLNQIMRKDADFFNNNFAGSLTKKIIGFSRSFEGFMDTLAFNVFGNILPLIFASFILWSISPLLVLLMFGFIITTLVVVLPFIRRRRQLTIKREANANLVAGHVADVIGNISAVQTFAHEKKEDQQHQKHVALYTKSALKSWDYHVSHVDMIVAPMYVIANTLGLLFAILLTNNAGTLAAVFIAFSYFGQATRILFEFNRTYRNLENALTEATQFTDLLVDEPAIKEHPHAKRLDITHGSVSFNNVSFAYPDTPDTPLFDAFNLVIKPGEKVAFVGHSGGGKTTITKLLLRLVDINSGELLIDGQNISQVTFESLRGGIAYVPQDPSMFHRSIADNIRYGKLDATDDEVLDAAEKAHALEFIEKLPKGFDTMVGERGVKLSGGQRQRIAIARAILKNAPILVLDEATSALDSESERLIQDALEKLMKNRTSIVIAHRLSTIAKLDRIIVLDNGAIAENGSHAELLKRGGIYAKLWSHQSGGFIEE